MGRKKPYLYKVGEVVNGLKILELTRHGRQNIKAYVVQSLTYPTAETYVKTENSFKSGRGDAYISNQRICLENSLYSIKRVRPYLVDVEQAKTISPNHTAYKIRVKCPTCNKERKIMPGNLLNQGFSCPVCSKGYYTENFFTAFNVVKNTGFKSQVNDLYKGYIFDYVNYKTRTIVEVHGLQHISKGNYWGNKDAYNRTVASDVAKRKWCKENGYTLIELDCSKSTFNFIMDSVNKEPLLPNIENEDIEAMLEIIEINSRYETKEIIELYTVKMESSTSIGKRFGYSCDIILSILRKNNITIRSSGINKGQSNLKLRKQVRLRGQPGPALFGLVDGFG